MVDVLKAIIEAVRQNPEWISAAVAFFSACWAVNESRKNARQAEERAREAEYHARALQEVVKAQVDMARHAQSLANSGVEAVRLAQNQIATTLRHLKEAAVAADEIAKQLRHIGSTALRAERDMLLAHEDLLHAAGLEKRGIRDKRINSPELLESQSQYLEAPSHRIEPNPAPAADG
jgi:hypothetical protein